MMVSFFSIRTSIRRQQLGRRSQWHANMTRIRPGSRQPTVQIGLYPLETMDTPGPVPTLRLGGNRLLTTMSATTEASAPPHVNSDVETYPLASLSLHLRQKIEHGLLKEDGAQLRAARRFDRLRQALEHYTNRPIVDAWYAIQRQSYEDLVRNQQIQKQLPQQGSANEQLANLSSSTPHVPFIQPLPLPTASPPPAATATAPVMSNLPRIPRGLYLHGPVGTGKSMLMDQFYQQYRHGCGEMASPRARREHFHAFLHDVHKRIHMIRQRDLQQRKALTQTQQSPGQRTLDQDTNTTVDDDAMRLQFLGYNPVERVAVQIAQETTLLCLDEFQIVDVADAYILSQLLQLLFQLGTVVVTTSNQAPRKLSYLGQESFFATTTSFVDLMEQYCVVHDMASSTDYRIVLAHDEDTKDDDHETTRMFLICQNSNDEETDSSKQVDDFMEQFRLMHHNHTAGDTTILDVGFGRSLRVPDGVLGRFKFQDLCSKCDWGAAEYRAIAKHYAAIVVENIPILMLDPDSSNPKELDQARRFVTFLDETYEARTALFCTAMAYPKDLFVTVSGMGNEYTTDHERAIATARRDLPFASKRAASRLIEMTSAKWWKNAMASRLK